MCYAANGSHACELVIKVVVKSCAKHYVHVYSHQIPVRLYCIIPGSHDCQLYWIHKLRALRKLTIFQPKDDLRGAIEATDKVGGELIVATQHGAAKVTKLDNIALLVHQDVVWLDVCMEHAAVLQMVQGHQHLLGVDAHPIQVEAHTSTILLGQLPQVDVLQSSQRPFKSGCF